MTYWLPTLCKRLYCRSCARPPRWQAPIKLQFRDEERYPEAAPAQGAGSSFKSFVVCSLVDNPEIEILHVRSGHTKAEHARFVRPTISEQC